MSLVFFHGDVCPPFTQRMHKLRIYLNHCLRSPILELIICNSTWQ